MMSEMFMTNEATARAFLKACDTGQGWEACLPYCTPSATFECQAAPLADVKDLNAYAKWMEWVVTVMPDAHYDVESLGISPDMSSVLIYAIIKGTHTGEGGPVPPTGQTTSSDYVYAIKFDNSKVSHVTKVWNSGWLMSQLHWA